MAKLDALVTGSSADLFNNNKFSIAKVALYNQIATTSTIETELNDVREYHMTIDVSYNKLYNIHRESVKHLKKVLDDYFGDPDKRDCFGFNIHPSSIKVYEDFALGVYLFSSSDDDY